MADYLPEIIWIIGVALVSAILVYSIALVVFAVVVQVTLAITFLRSAYRHKWIGLTVWILGTGSLWHHILTRTQSVCAEDPSACQTSRLNLVLDAIRFDLMVWLPLSSAFVMLIAATVVMVLHSRQQIKWRLRATD